MVCHRHLETPQLRLLSDKKGDLTLTYQTDNLSGEEQPLDSTDKRRSARFSGT